MTDTFEPTEARIRYVPLTYSTITSQVLQKGELAEAMARQGNYDGANEALQTAELKVDYLRREGSTEDTTPERLETLEGMIDNSRRNIQGIKESRERIAEGIRRLLR